MHLKTYRAPTTAEALAQVKSDLGKDAVIIHTRQFKVGTVLGLGGKTVIEITASQGKPGQTRSVSRSISPRATLTADESTLPRVQSAGLPAEVPSTRLKPIAATPARMGVIEDPLPTTLERRVVPTEPPVTLTPATADLEAQMQSLKKLVGQVLQCTRHTAAFVARSQQSSPEWAKSGRAAVAPSILPGTVPDPLFQQYLQLIESEVAGEIADEVLARVRDELSSKDAHDPGLVRQSMVRHLASMIPADPDIARPTKPRDGRPLTIALVGPTGVGKTTTLAKLAATYKLRFGKKVRLITSDTYRIAAVEQLRTYAQIIGLPVEVVMTPQDMASACAGASADEIVLIDTAGRSPRDAGKLDDLAKLMAAAKPHFTHLVLAGTSGASSMVQAAERFAAVKPNRIILSKLDEAVNFGVLISAAKTIDLKISYLTTGQEVPDHIEVGKPERLARMVMEGELARPKPVGGQDAARSAFVPESAA